MVADDYKRENAIEYLADFPGADIPRDLVKVSVTTWDGKPLDVSAATVTVTDDGELNINTLPDVTVGSWTAGTLPIQEDTPLDVSGGVVSIQEDTPLDVSGATVTVTDDGALDVNTLPDVTVGTWSAGTLAVQEDTPLDVSASTVSTSDQYHDQGSWEKAALSADGSLTLSLRTDGADRLRGRVVSDNTYSVEVDWLNDAGTVIFTDSIATGVAGGTTTPLDELAIAPDVDVRIIEGASAASVADGVVHIA